MSRFYEWIAGVLTRRFEPAAARRIRDLEEARDVPGLLKALGEGDYAVKGRAASALGRLPRRRGRGLPLSSGGRTAPGVYCFALRVRGSRLGLAPYK